SGNNFEGLKYIIYKIGEKAGLFAFILYKKRDRIQMIRSLKKHP
ncbi:hypothetical protein HMPREF3209_00828, partial [Lactobacillus crispatus]